MPDFIHRRRVEFFETDMARIVNFARFYTWMEEAEHAWFRGLGLKIMTQRPDGTYLGWPRVSASCHFESPARYDDELEVQLTVERIGLKSMNYLIEFHREERRLAHGRLKTACCICRPDGTLTSIEIPREFRDLFPSR